MLWWWYVVILGRYYVVYNMSGKDLVRKSIHQSDMECHFWVRRGEVSGDSMSGAGISHPLLIKPISSKLAHLHLLVFLPFLQILTEHCKIIESSNFLNSSPLLVFVSLFLLLSFLASAALAIARPSLAAKWQSCRPSWAKRLCLAANAGEPHLVMMVVVVVAATSWL